MIVVRQKKVFIAFKLSFKGEGVASPGILLLFWIKLLLMLMFLHEKGNSLNLILKQFNLYEHVLGKPQIN
jgi:hypothetical protein